MGAAAHRALDAPGQREHLPALLHRPVGRDEGPALLAGLDHEDSERQPADDPVAPREVLGRRGGSQREFAHERAAVRDAPRQESVFGRIHGRDSAAEDRERAPLLRPEGAHMGFGVDAARKPAHHGDADLRQLAAEPRRLPHPVGRGLPRPDESDPEEVALFERPPHIEHERRIVQRGERRGISGSPVRQDRDPLGRRLLDLDGRRPRAGLFDDRGRGQVSDPLDALEFRRRGAQGGLGGPEALAQAAMQRRADEAGEVQGYEGFKIIFHTPECAGSAEDRTPVSRFRCPVPGSGLGLGDSETGRWKRGTGDS